VNATDMDAVYDMADRIYDFIIDTPQSPSQIARKAKVRTTDVGPALAWMTERRFIVATGNGCWRKYRARRFGE
jgi:hypothetical protein